MKVLTVLLLSIHLLAANKALAETTPTDPAILAVGAYVPTDNLAASEAFYRTLFDRDPTFALNDFVAFDIEGGWFAIVSRAKYAPNSVSGTGSVPYLQSADLEEMQARVAQTGRVVPEIIEEPGIDILKVVDPNGQLIEFFSLTAQ
ncbi:MAG: hypothetical protein AAF088_15555 [Pseudomonadota bacterium]